MRFILRVSEKQQQSPGGVRVERVWFRWLSVNTCLEQCSLKPAAGNSCPALSNVPLSRSFCPTACAQACCAFHSRAPNGTVGCVWFDSKDSNQRRQVLRWRLLQGRQQVSLHRPGRGFCLALSPCQRGDTASDWMSSKVDCTYDNLIYRGRQLDRNNQVDRDTLQTPSVIKAARLSPPVGNICSFELHTLFFFLPREFLMVFERNLSVC